MARDKFRFVFVRSGDSPAGQATPSNMPPSALPPTPEPKFKWQDAVGIVGGIIGLGAIAEMPPLARVACFTVCAICLSISFGSHKSWPLAMRWFASIAVFAVMSLVSLSVVRAKKEDPPPSVTNNYYAPQTKIDIDLGLPVFLWGAMNDKNPNEGTIVTADASVVNRGNAPGLVLIKGARMEVKNGSIVEGKLVWGTSKTIFIKGRNGNPDVTLPPDRQLIRTLAQAVPGPGTTTGWIRYVFEGLTPQMIADDGKFTLLLEDENKRPITKTITLHGTHDVNGVYMPIRPQ